MSTIPGIASEAQEAENANAAANSKRDEVRQRLRQRVDRLLVQCNQAAGLKGTVAAKPASPPAPDVPPPEPAESTAPAAQERQQPSRAEHRALVVEGNPLHRKVLVRALEKSGYEVDTVESAAETLETFQRCPYGIVLLDCDTPEIDGYGTAASLRLIEGAARHTPIVGLTGNAGQSHRRERKAAGIDNYLLKPFRRDLVESVVSRYLPSRSQQASQRHLALDKDRIRELQDLAHGDPNLIGELIDLFLTNAPELLQVMRRAAEDEDASGLRRAAHTLKGSSGQMGALRMQELCGMVETLSSTGSLVGVETILGEVSVAFERAVSELKTLASGAAEAEGAAGEAEAASRMQPSANPPAKSKDILLAEDDPLIARFLSASLTAAGFHVTHVTDGQTALESIRAKNFAVVVLDINMPGADGYQVLTEIRASVGEATPVAIISSRHQEQDVLRAFDLGVDDYLTKPFNPSEVVARVRRLARHAARS